MRKIKTKLYLVLLAIIIGVVGGCSTNDKRIKVGILQYVSHSALDNAKDGIIEAFKNKGYDETKVRFQIKNPQADNATMSNMAKELLRNNDLVVAIATPAAISLVNEAKESNSKVPILFTAVTDPVEAGLVRSNENPGGNVTGTNDMNPVALQIDLAKELLPSIKKIGIAYTSSEVNSQIQVDLAVARANELGILVETTTISNVNEIQMAVSTLISNKKIELLYIPTDNLFASAMEIVADVTISSKIPTICGATSMIEKGGIITLGIDYKKLGILTGDMAILILEGVKQPSSFAVQSLTEFDLIINKQLANQIDLTIPEILLHQAKEIIE